MSSGARQRAPVTRFLGIGARLLFRLLVLVLGIGVAAGAAALLLAWRLGQGPLDVGAALPWIDMLLNRPGGQGWGRARVEVGAASLSWAGFRDLDAPGLQLAAGDVTLVDPDGRRLAGAGGIRVVLAVPPLLAGEVAPRSIEARGATLLLRREADGTLSLDLGGTAPKAAMDPQPAPETVPAPASPPVTLTEGLAVLARPAGGGGRGVLRHLDGLRQVTLSRSALLVLQHGEPAPWRLGIEQLDLRRQRQGGVVGRAEAALLAGGARAAARIDAELAADGGTEIRFDIAPLPAAPAQAALPVPDDAPVLEAMVGAEGRLRLSPDLAPREARLSIEAGAGRLRLGTEAVGFERLRLAAEAHWTEPGWTLPQSLALHDAQAVLAAPGGATTTLLLGARFDRTAAGLLEGAADVGFDRIAFADLGALWPARWGGHVRPWLVENLTAGTARDGQARIGLRLAPDLGHAEITALSGGFAGEEATVHWLRPVPPVEHVKARLTLRDPDVIDIDVAAGRQGGLGLRNGQIRFTGISQKDQFMTLSADIAGGVPELVGLLRHPRLHLLDKRPLPSPNPAGSFSGHLSLDMPMLQNLSFDDLRIGATGRTAGLRLPGLLAGRDLDRGDFSFEVSPDALSAQGAAVVAGIASQVTVGLDFRAGGPAQVQTRASLAARATPGQLAAAGLDLGGILAGGTARIEARYAQRRDGQAEAQVEADLSEAALALVGWSKPPGPPALARARLPLRADRLLGIEDLHAEGPEMAADGRIGMVGGRPLDITLDRLVLGGTRGRGRVLLPERPGAPIRATLAGEVLDLTAELSAGGEPDGKGGQTPWSADVRFGRVVLGGQGGLSQVSGHAEHDGRRLRVLDVRSGGAEQAVVRLAPGAGGRRLMLSAADGGAVLRAAGLTESISGGRLTLEGEFDDSRPDSPLSGKAELTGFRVRNAPVLGKLLQAITVYGLVEALSGPGLSFTRLTLPFRFAAGVLTVTDARAFSASLGLTARGTLDTRRHWLDMRGTVVPAYALNAALGHIPLVGRLFSAERGGGLVAVNYALSGPSTDPSVSVNPLSALTPGFLRNLFRALE